MEKPLGTKIGEVLSVACYSRILQVRYQKVGEVIGKTSKS